MAAAVPPLTTFSGHLISGIRRPSSGWTFIRRPCLHLLQIFLSTRLYLHLLISRASWFLDLFGVRPRIAMSIAFNVENLGPIGQIGLDVDNVLTITRLATSAASWFTSSSQTLSLAQTISSNGASLVPASIFNRIRYNNIRQRYGVTWGAARVSGGILKRVRLSNVSTATEGDPGLICLRAIIIALLCFVEEHTIVDILKKVLPSRLFHYEQEDREIEMEGPYLAALKQHIKETVKEELRDDFRSKLLDTIDNQIHRVSNATREELLDVQYMDEWLISGLLDWALTPVATRESSTYYTRSVRVWSLALILSELGFDIQAVRTAIKEPYEDNTADSNAYGYEGIVEVVLVLSSGWPTDSGWKISKEYNPKTKQPPRIIPIRAYPSISYSDYVNRVEVEERQPYDAQMLETAFINTFVESRSVLSTIPIIQRLAHIEQLNPLRLPEEKVFDACLHQYIEQYIRYPGTDDLDIISKVILPPMQRYLTPWRGSIDLDSMIGSKRVEWMTRTICWAVVLSVLSLFVRSTNSNVIEAKLDMEFVYTETDAGEAISELLSQLNDMTETSLGLKHQSSNKWIKFVVQVCLWWLLNSIMSKSSQKMTNINTESCDECFGAQCNGLSVISEFILRPSALISSVYVLHSVRGQLLDIPTSDGFIVASRFSNYMGRYLDIRNLRPFQTKEEVISALSTSGCNSTSPIRLDVEPDWKYDPSHIELNIRTDGILRAQLSISRLIYLDGISPALYYNCGEQQGHIHHYCPGPETISELLTDDMWGRKWYYLPFQEMIRNGQISMKNPDSDRNRSNWITRIHDALTFMLALQCRDHTWTIYVTDCLGAALFYIALYDDRPVVIIIYEESHNRLLELGPEDPRRFHRRATELASFWIHAPSKSAEFPSPCRSRLSVRERRSILKKRMFQWILPPAFRHVLGDF